MVIITTRNEDLLDRIKVKAKYKVNVMDEDESRQLFTQHAFREDKISDTFTEFSRKILEHAGGLPLALQVFGSTLLNEPEDGWRWFIDRMKQASVDDVEGNLMISFDALKLFDPNLQDIFLDLACFYIGRKKEEAVKILGTCYTSVNYKIGILRKRSLITIDNEDGLGMHDLLQDMGRRIARNNSPDDPGKHSRLWVSGEIDNVLKNHEGTEAIQSIIFGYDYRHRMKGVTYLAESFKRMRKLKFLQLQDVNLTGSFKQTFKDLRWLCWKFCPLECLPSEFYTEKLVILELPDSNMRTIWELNMAPQVFKKLKTLNMSGSRNLKTTPDFNRLPCLETLNLEFCSSLEEVHVSIGSLASLVNLNLGFCDKLRSLPDSICRLRALEVLDITCCIILEALPTELGNIESLKMLIASGSSVLIPDSIRRLSNLVELGLNGNKNLKTLPHSICKLRSLEILGIGECMQLKELPDQVGMITSLRVLFLFRDTILEMLPDISQLLNLEDLILDHCHNLWSISELPPNLKSMTARECGSLKRLPDLSSLKHLKELHLTHCEALKEIQGLEDVTSLEDLSLYKCKSIERLPNLCNLKHLKKLDLEHCDSLKEIIGLEELTSLEDFKFGYCVSLLSVIKLPPNLKWVSADGCTSLKHLPNLSDVKHLEMLKLAKCSGLTKIQGWEDLTSLKELDLGGCNSSLLASTLTKRFFQILSGFGHKVLIFIDLYDWRNSLKVQTVRYCRKVGIELKLGSRISLYLQPNESHNFLGIILAFDSIPCFGVKYSVKNITSGFIWSDDTRNSYNVSFVIVPKSMLLIRDGDDGIEITLDKEMIYGIRLLYKTEITMISNPSLSDLESHKMNLLSLGGNTNNVEDEISNRKWLSLGSSSTTVNVGEQRSNLSDNDPESNKNWLSLGSSSTTVDIGEEKGHPSKPLKHLECDNNWLSL